MAANGVKQALVMVGDYVIGAAVLVVIGVAVGTWIDGKAHTGPLWTIILALVGGALGLARLILKAVQMGAADQDNISSAGTPATAEPASTNSQAATDRAQEPPSANPRSKPKHENPKSSFDFLEHVDQD